MHTRLASRERPRQREAIESSLKTVRSPHAVTYRAAYQVLQSPACTGCGSRAARTSAAARCHIGGRRLWGPRAR
eukprot:519128-Prymnesium_polylepis.1